ncbi:MAG: AAA family ATPase [Candidatus Sumerlaeota bacterium]|nr:AAA family ATPase [Candidatus Sumerlaeota bacterium]
MRINNLEIYGFRCFENHEFQFHPHFNLIVGDNGFGKTALLEALSVAMGIWPLALARPASECRAINPGDVRLRTQQEGDRLVFKRVTDCVISAHGIIGDFSGLDWKRKWFFKWGFDGRTSNASAKLAIEKICDIIKSASAGAETVLPLVAYYSAGRAWLPARERVAKLKPDMSKKTPLDAYYYCLDGRIRLSAINEWFMWEKLAANGLGKERAGYRAVLEAVLKCLPGSQNLSFDSDRKEIIIHFATHQIPFYCLSDGQRCMMSLVADMAIKAVTLNPHLGEQAALETPGIALIDELELHIHPTWQRNIVKQLKDAFPMVQFFGTTHSPQIIGETPADEILRLNQLGHPIKEKQSYGMDSNWILENMQDAQKQDPEIKTRISRIFELITRGDLQTAEVENTTLKKEIGDTEDTQRADAVIQRIRILGK